jgi:hypothetical protein
MAASERAWKAVAVRSARARADSEFDSGDVFERGRSMREVIIEVHDLKLPLFRWQKPR